MIALGSGVSPGGIVAGAARRHQQDAAPGRRRVVPVIERDDVARLQSRQVDVEAVGRAGRRRRAGDGAVRKRLRKPGRQLVELALHLHERAVAKLDGRADLAGADEAAGDHVDGHAADRRRRDRADAALGGVGGIGRLRREPAAAVEAEDDRLAAVVEGQAGAGHDRQRPALPVHHLHVHELRQLGDEPVALVEQARSGGRRGRRLDVGIELSDAREQVVGAVHRGGDAALGLAAHRLHALGDRRDMARQDIGR